VHFGYYRGPSHWNNQDARQSARDAESAARGAQSHVERLEGEIERLLMVCEALWTMVKEDSGRNDDHLVARIAEIDMRDGKLDGRVSTKDGPYECPECRRPIARKRAVCMYCGTAIVLDPFSR